MNVDDAHAKVAQLHLDLKALADRDPEQEVEGSALRVIDAVVAVARDALPHDPVVASIDVIEADAIAAGKPLRAADLLLSVGQLEAALARALPEPPMMGVSFDEP